MKKISFVIPCYRSEHTIAHVAAEIDAKMKTLTHANGSSAKIRCVLSINAQPTTKIVLRMYRN